MSSPREASRCDAVITQAASPKPDAANVSVPEEGAVNPHAVDADPLQQRCGNTQPGNAQTGEDGPRHGRLCSASRLQVGPLRLPRLHQAEFVQQFNQLYRSLGMRLEVLEEQPADPS